MNHPAQMGVCLVISSLGAGGAERVLTTLANHWAAAGWTVTLLTLDDGRERPFFPLHPAICHLPLGVAGRAASPVHGLLNNLRRLRALRREIRRASPQAVLAFVDKTNVLTLLATCGLGLPVVISERTDPAQHQIGRIWRLLRTWLYPMASRLVVQSPGALAYFPDRVRQRACVIANPAPLARVQSLRPAYNQVIALGRLSPEKGFDLLLDAFAEVAPRFPDWSLAIWGEGPSRTQLEAQRDRLGLAERVGFPGRTNAPQAALTEGSIFVLSSRYEGFPNALLEAMAVGLPVIAFDCPSGPRDIVRSGYDGLLVPPQDTEALAATLARLMGDPAERSRLGEHALEVCERFTLTAVASQWEALLRSG